MILSPIDVLKTIADAAEAAYPEEACGFLVGRRGARRTIINRAIPSRNLAAGLRPKWFEADPKVRFDVMRSLRDSSEDLVGHYHSHPDHPSDPSPTDLQMAFEPDLIWLIVSVSGGQAVHVGAFRPVAERSRFRRHMLQTIP